MSEEDVKAKEAEWMELFGNALLIAAMLPEEGHAGTFRCPACKMGMVRWARAPSNKHVRFKCDGCKTGLIQ